jgi:hypothetical protein
MKRTLAAVAAAGASILLATAFLATALLATALPATAPAYAKPVPKAALTITPRWTYVADGEFAVVAQCPARADRRVIFSRLLYRPVTVPGAGRLLILVTGKTKPGTYTIGLLCAGAHGWADAADVKTITVRKQLAGWIMVSPPALPRHFKPDLTVQTGVRQVIVPAPLSHRR